MKAYSIRFHGRVLARGFWIYVVDIQSAKGRALYVGRTGDSSSPHAGSPFSRLGQHLDLRSNAKGNALLRNLRREGIDPTASELEMIAVGPLFPEEDAFESHRPVRDKMAALERGLAGSLRARGYRVLGKHAASATAETAALERVLALVEARLAKEGEAAGQPDAADQRGGGR